MIIIQLAGGLGNQMFQYALYLQLKSLGREVRIDDVSGFAQDAQRQPALAPFGISYERASRKELERMLDASMLPWNRVRRKLCGRKKKAYFEADKRYKPEIMEWDDIYLEGYWQTEKYFQAVSEQVRQAYDVDGLLAYLGIGRDAGDHVRMAKHGNQPSTLRVQLSKDGERAASDCGHPFGNRFWTVSDWLADITCVRSVSVHIRRGDYLLPENEALFGGICTEQYYRTAMKMMLQAYPDCKFYFFTNDKKWVRGWLAEMGKEICADMPKAEAGNVCDGVFHIVDLGETDDYAEFALMSKCRHHILANSSFSWWASYLNQDSDQMVLAPDRWLNGWDCEDFYRQDMRRVKGIYNT